MKCPYCHETENRVIDSRLSKDNNMIRRRRECGRCNRRFTTYERVEEMMPLVVKKDGRRESYDRLKIINGLRRACEKRPVSINTIETIADRIERAVDIRINRIRRKVEVDPAKPMVIRTIRHVGYIYVPPRVTQ